MCEHCRRITKHRVRKLTAEMINGESMPCDYCAVERDDLDTPAWWIVQQLQVETHYCEEHANKRMELAEEGPGDILRAAGLEEENDFWPIIEQVDCDYKSPPEGEEEKSERCARPAIYAYASVSDSFLCEEHVRPFREG